MHTPTGQCVSECRRTGCEGFDMSKFMGMPSMEDMIAKAEKKVEAKEWSKIQAVKDILMKYTDPKPEFTGISAHAISNKILEAII